VRGSLRVTIGCGAVDEDVAALEVVDNDVDEVVE
jgi:hypothetical protein